MRRTFRIILSILSGVMLSLPWLGFPGWILFAAFMPLLGLDDYINRHKSEFKGVTFWGYSFLTFLIWNGMTTWWIVHATVAGMIMAVFLNSFFMSLVFWMAHTIRRHSKASQGSLAFVVFWISFELIHFHWDIEWPWLTLGNGFANNIRMIQWYEFTGTL